MSKSKELIELTKMSKELEQEYKPELALGIVKRFKKIIDKDGIENRMYMEAIQEMLEALDNGDTTVKSCYKDIETIFTQYESLLLSYKTEKMTMHRESFLRVNMTIPIALLMALYIFNHPEYNSNVDLWDFDEQLEPFVEALEDE